MNAGGDTRGPKKSPATEPLFSVRSDARPWARGSVSTFVSSGGISL